MKEILTVLLSLATLAFCSTGFAQSLAAPGVDVLAPLPMRGIGSVASAIPESDVFRGSDGGLQPQPIRASGREPPSFLKIESDDVRLRTLVFVGVVAIQARTSRTTDALGFPSPTLLKDPAQPLRRDQLEAPVVYR